MTEIAETGIGGAGIVRTERVAPVGVDGVGLVVGSARQGVAALAPEEVPYFDKVAEQWRKRGGLSSRRTPGAAVGFGVDAVLVSELVLQVVAGAVTEMTVRGGDSAVRRLLHRVRGRKVVPPGRSEQLREAVRRHAVTLGLSEAQADLLADAAEAELNRQERG